MTFLDYLALLRQRLVVASAVVGVTAFIALGLAFVRGPEFSAQTRLRALPPASGSGAADLLAREQTDLVTESELLKSFAVAERVKQKLNQPGADNDTLLDSINVAGVGDSAIMIVEARAERADTAQALANTFATAYLEVRRETANARLDSFAKSAADRLAAAQAQLTDIQNRLRSVAVNSPDRGPLETQATAAESAVLLAQATLQAAADRRAVNEGFGEVTRPAVRATPVRVASPVRSLVFGLLIGVVLAIAAALLLDALSNTVRTRDDARTHSGSDVLATVPEDVDWDDVELARLVTDVDPLSPVSEAYRTLRQNLRAVTADHEGPVSILVTSGLAGEGKSTTAANLAMAFADTGQSVVIVDADLRAPRLHLFLSANEAPGLTEVLDEQVEASTALQWVRARLGLLAAGAGVERPDRALLQADIPALLASLSGLAAVGRPRRRGASPDGNGDGRRSAVGAGTLIVDAPPILQAAEVSSLAACVDGVILVLRAGVSTREATANAAEQIHKAGGRLLGVVLVGARPDGGTGSVRTELPTPRRLARAGLVRTGSR